MKSQINPILIVLLLSVSVSFSIASLGPVLVQRTDGRTEQILDTTNNNLRLSMEAPDSWVSGIISQTVPDLNWRLNVLNAFES